MNIEDITVSSPTARKRYSAAQLITVLDGGGGGGGGGTPRTDQNVSYFTLSVAPTVFFTALGTNGSTVLVARTQTGVSQVGTLPIWKYDMTIGAFTDFLAVWDEGDVNDYVVEWVVVDT